MYDLPSGAGQGPDIVQDVRAPQQGNHVAASQGSKNGQCGKRNAHGVTGRINNPAQIVDEGDTEFGEPDQPCAVTNAASVLGEYPWQAALLKKEEYDNVYVCGGSLIDSSHILTAAHCVKHLQPGEIRARLGEWDVNNDGEFFPNILSLMFSASPSTRSSTPVTCTMTSLSSSWAVLSTSLEILTFLQCVFLIHSRLVNWLKAAFLY